MTFDDDACVFDTPEGRKFVRCSDLGVDWPPPQHLHIADLSFARISLSSINDEQRAKMTHVMRCALYEKL